MDFAAILDELMGQISEFAQAKPLIALAVLLILAYFIYRKPFFFLFVFILGLILTGVLYMILSIASPGLSQKEKMIRKEKEPENSFSLPIKL